MEKGEMVRTDETIESSEPYDALLQHGWPKQAVVKFLQRQMIDKLPYLIVKDLSTPNLSKVTFSLQKGDMLGILGVEGSGKSSLLQAMMGMHDPLGEVHLKLEKDYVNLLEHKEVIKTQCGFSTQQPSLYPELTVRENLQLFASLYGYPAAKAALQVQGLLALLDLTLVADQAVHTLPRSTLKRVDLACALVNDPDLILLDNVTEGMDAFSKQKVHTLLTRLAKRGTTIILVTPDITEVEKLCNKVVIMHNGRIHASSRTEDLKRRFNLDLFSLNVHLWGHTPLGLREAFRNEPLQDLLITENSISCKTKHPESLLKKVADALGPHALDHITLSQPSFEEHVKSLLHAAQISAE